jgi:hypothetical protein
MVRAQLLLGGFYSVALSEASSLLVAVAQTDARGWAGSSSALQVSSARVCPSNCSAAHISPLLSHSGAAGHSHIHVPR